MEFGRTTFLDGELKRTDPLKTQGVDATFPDGAVVFDGLSNWFGVLRLSPPRRECGFPPKAARVSDAQQPFTVRQPATGPPLPFFRVAGVSYSSEVRRLARKNAICPTGGYIGRGFGSRAGSRCMRWASASRKILLSVSPIAVRVPTTKFSWRLPLEPNLPRITISVGAIPAQKAEIVHFCYGHCKNAPRTYRAVTVHRPERTVRM